jgi:two-component system NtrC family response regulator
MADGSLVTPADLELEGTGQDEGPGRGLRELREGLERDAVRKALARNRGNVSQAANDLGVSRPTLYGLMERLGIAREPEGP